MKKVKYIRVSSVGQNLDRQKEDSVQYDLVIEDKVSGTIPFFERTGGIQIRKMIDSGVTFELHVHSIDRLGRNLQDILCVIKLLSDNGINVICYSQGLRTLDTDLRPNPVGKLILGILGSVAEMERDQIKERQLEGIRIAKLNGKYLGRRLGSKESTLRFLSKEKVKICISYLRRGFKAKEAATLSKLHPNSVTKIKKLCWRELKTT